MTSDLWRRRLQICCQIGCQIFLTGAASQQNSQEIRSILNTNLAEGQGFEPWKGLHL